VGQIGGNRGQTGGVGGCFIKTPPHPLEEGADIPIFIVSIDFLLYRCSLLDIQRIYILVHTIFNNI